MIGSISFIMRALAVSVAAGLLGVGWGAVWELNRLRKLFNRVEPAPNWANVTLMTGIMLVSIGVLWGNWAYIDRPWTPPLFMIVVGMVLKLIGMTGLLRALSKGGKG